MSRSAGKIKRCLQYVYYYLNAKRIMMFHFKKELFIRGRWFQGEKYGALTAPGWKWVVNDYYACKRMRQNTDIPWPCSPRISVFCPNNIEFHPDDLNNFQGFGNYFQAIGRIVIGRGTYIAPNVGIITANHSVFQLDLHNQPKQVTIGEKCWIGMNSIVLPGVTLGDRTIVGAGSIVTKSFPDGYCVIAGNPAKIIKVLDSENLNNDGEI